MEAGCENVSRPGDPRPAAGQQAPPQAAQPDLSRICPRCGQTLYERSCELICARCGYYLSCNDF